MKGVNQIVDERPFRQYPPPAGGGLIEGERRHHEEILQNDIPRPRAGASLKVHLDAAAKGIPRCISPARGRGPH